MVLALILFAATYVLMLTFSKYRPYIALGSAAIFIVTGMLPLGEIWPSIDLNVILMIASLAATLGGNCTPIGASANITGIGILRREGYEVKNSDFFKIGIPFTLAAIIPAYIYIWLIYGV